jgi:hypothetical protein
MWEQVCDKMRKQFKEQHPFAPWSLSGNITNYLPCCRAVFLSANQTTSCLCSCLERLLISHVPKAKVHSSSSSPSKSCGLALSSSHRCLLWNVISPRAPPDLCLTPRHKSCVLCSWVPYSSPLGDLSRPTLRHLRSNCLVLVSSAWLSTSCCQDQCMFHRKSAAWHLLWHPTPEWINSK